MAHVARSPTPEIRSPQSSAAARQVAPAEQPVQSPDVHHLKGTIMGYGGYSKYSPSTGKTYHYGRNGYSGYSKHSPSTGKTYHYGRNGYSGYSKHSPSTGKTYRYPR